jgi:adenylosuccinate synthase
MGQVYVVVGGQFGSEAKGHVTDWIVRSHATDVAGVIRVAGPNAGHTAYDDEGRGWALRQVPCAAVSRKGVNLFIAAGSEIDPEVLNDEVKRLDEAGFDVSNRLFVDSQATVIERKHQNAEKDLTVRIGSTGKGIGAARASRINREALTWAQYCQQTADQPGYQHCDTARVYPDLLFQGQDLVIEGTQGYGLGLHAGYYPHCTSSDCRAVDFLAMAGISPWAPEIDDLHVWLTMRTYPIRVAGNSGPMFRELDWAQLSERTGGYIKPERTTVTKNIRRIGEWDTVLARSAIEAHGGPRAGNVHIALTFFDYWFPEAAGFTKREQLTPAMWSRVSETEVALGNMKVSALGTGPATMIPLAYP